MTQQAFARLVLLSLSTFLLSGSLPQSQTGIQEEIDALTKRGFTVRLLDNDLVELTDPLSGEKHLKSLREPHEAEIRDWAAARGIPILEIDPSTIDTNKYAGWYKYWTTVPLGNSNGNRLVLGDLNINRQADVYGGYLDTLSVEYQTRLYEVDSGGTTWLRYEYVPRPGVSRQIADVDQDSLWEVVFGFGGIVSGYEQQSGDSLPIRLIYAHDRFYHNSQAAGPNSEFMGDLDGDSLTDFLYQGTGPDPNDTNIAISKTYVTEYDPSLQNFVRVWSTQFYPNSGAHGFAVWDFDSDGKIEFVATHASGRVYVAENTGDNEYTMTWQDSTPFVNFYDIGSGDINNDGSVEFLTGAVMSNGSWTLVYEADSNNAYSAKFLFHVLSGGLLAGTQYVVVDIDGDTNLELAIKVGGELYAFKPAAGNTYALWYLRRENAMDGVTFYDFNHDGRQDIIISRFVVNSEGRGRLFSDICLATTLVSVHDQAQVPSRISLHDIYPNPFNPNATIEYSLENRGWVLLRIYDFLGKTVATLVNAEQRGGKHRVVWNATGVASGVYLCRLEVVGVAFTKKMVLIR